MVYYRSGGFGREGSRGLKGSKVGWEVDLYVRGLQRHLQPGKKV
jgi:hypothetical protein